MNVKHKPGGSQVRRVAKEKIIPVHDNSLQAKAPGAELPGQGNQQSGAGASSAGAIPSARRRESGAAAVGERGGAGAQQAGWSSRQQAERMSSRADEARQGQPQQSGYGGTEQKQHAGSKESPSAPRSVPGQGRAAAQPQDNTSLPPSDAGGKRSR